MKYILRISFNETPVSPCFTTMAYTFCYPNRDQIMREKPLTSN